MKIDFTKEQFETLLKAVYLGNWMVKNAEVEEEDSDKDFEDLESYILTQAAKFGLDQYADFDEEEKKHLRLQGT